MKRLSILALACFLVACGDDSTDSPQSPGNANQFITGSVSGAVESDLALTGVIKCQDSGLEGVQDVWEMIGGGAGQQVAIATPFTETSVGEYELIGSGDNRSTMFDNRYEIRYRAADLSTRVFDSGSGTLTITEFPTQPGESVQATFSADLVNDEGQSVTVQGTVQGEAPSFAFDDCE